MELKFIYTNYIDSKIDDGFQLSYDEVFTKAIINRILSSTFRQGAAEAYAQSRIKVIREFLDSKPQFLSTKDRTEIERAITLVSDFIVEKSYKVDIEFKDLEDETDLYIDLKIGDDDTDSTDNKTGKYNNITGVKTSMYFNWSLSQSVMVELKDDNDDKLADIYSDTNSSRISLSLFSKSAWQDKSNAHSEAFLWVFNSEPVAKNVKFRFKLYDNRGREITTEQFHLVEKYIINNKFWDAMRKKALEISL